MYTHTRTEMVVWAGQRLAFDPGTGERTVLVTHNTPAEHGRALQVPAACGVAARSNSTACTQHAFCECPNSTACDLRALQQYSMRSARACKRVALPNAPLTWRPLMRARASHDTAWPQPSPHPSAQLTDCQPSPTLSPTDPVPRDLLTLCPAPTDRGMSLLTSCELRFLPTSAPLSTPIRSQRGCLPPRQLARRACSF